MLADYDSCSNHCDKIHACLSLRTCAFVDYIPLDYTMSQIKHRNIQSNTKINHLKTNNALMLLITTLLMKNINYHSKAPSQLGIDKHV